MRCRFLVYGSARLWQHTRTIGSLSHTTILYARTTGIRTASIPARNNLRLAVIPNVLPYSTYTLSRPPHWCAGRVASARLFCSFTDNEARKRVEDLFFEARELLEDARSSAGTVYFNEDMQDAKAAVQEAVQEAISHYEDLLNMLNREQRESVMAVIGLKMEELKAQLIALTEEMDN